MHTKKTIEDCYREIASKTHAPAPIQEQVKDPFVAKYTKKKKVVKEDCGTYSSPSFSYAIRGKNVNTLGPTPLGFPGSLETKVIPLGLKVKVKAPKGKLANRRLKQSPRNSQGKTQS